MKGFWAAINFFYGRGDETSVIRSQWNKFSCGQDDFASAEALYDMQAKKDPIEWWWNHGGDTPELQSFAIRLLSQVTSWSTYGFIHSLKRNRLGSKKVENLVYIHRTLLFLSRVDPTYMEDPSAKWDQIAHDGDVAAMVEEVVEPNGLNELLLVVLPSKEPELER